MSHRRSHADNVETMAQLIAGLLPPLALEARISGGNALGDQLVTQLGLSVQAAQNVDMAILARTSGTAFVVGIGSIMAYKLLCRLAKSNCLWSSIDQLIEQRSSLVASSTDGGCSADAAAGDDPSPSSSPSRTVQLTDGFYAVRLGGENELLRKLDECFCRKDSGGGGSSTASSSASIGIAPPGEQLAVVQVRHGRNLRRLIRQNQRVQREGIEALQQQDHYEQQQKHGPTRGVLLRAEEQQQRMSRDDEDNESVISNLTSASRIPPNPNAVERVPPLQLPPDDDSNDRDGRRASTAASSTPISALLHCPNAEDELCWENEFSSASEAGDDDAPPDGRPTQSADEIMGGSDTEGLFLFRERCISLGSLSQLSAMKNLERMFRGMAPTDWRHGDGEETTNWTTGGDECHGTEHRLVDSALDNLRELDRLDVNTNVSSSMVSNSGGGRLARRCWLDMEGGAGGTRGPGSAAYRIAGSKSDLDISEMSSSSICSRPQMIAIQRNHQKQLPPHPHHHHQHKSHGLWELTSLNFSSTPAVDNDDKQHLGGNNNPAFYSRFTHEKRNAKAAKAVSAPMPVKQNNDAEQGKVNDDGIVAVQQQQHSADDTTDDGWEEDGIFAQCQKSPPCQQQQSSLLLTPAATSSSSTMVDSVISCHSSLASTSAFSTQQRCSNSAEMLTSGAGGVMFDSAIVSDGGAPSNLGFFGHEHDEQQQKEEEGLEEVKNNESLAPLDVSTPRRF
ncbi:hypothetical protein niasHT_006101 [Heterodera trifolii]|uniref:Uncharacterized protein n=1 Tax=Heterodera trifolii TaxID=157864 RepID=A0ABD2LY17_9BILA